MHSPLWHNNGINYPFFTRLVKIASNCCGARGSHPVMSSHLKIPDSVFLFLLVFTRMISVWSDQSRLSMPAGWGATVRCWSSCWALTGGIEELGCRGLTFECWLFIGCRDLQWTTWTWTTTCEIIILYWSFLHVFLSWWTPGCTIKSISPTSFITWIQIQYFLNTSQDLGHMMVVILTNNCFPRVFSRKGEWKSWLFIRKQTWFGCLLAVWSEQTEWTCLCRTVKCV